MAIEVKLPKMGESVAEATITKWLKSVGEPIAEEESLVEIATDKVDSEVPAPASGILSEIFFQEGDVAQVGEVIALIDDGLSDSSGSSDQNSSVKEDDPIPPSPTPTPTEVPFVGQESLSGKPNPSDTQIKDSALKEKSSKFFSPLVKSMAKKENVSLSELEDINGSGKDGRVTKADMLVYLENRGSASKAQTVAASQDKISKEPEPNIVAKPKVAVSQTEERQTSKKSYPDNVEVIEMDRMRKLIAEHMVESKKTSPHVTSFVEADVTNLVKWREANKQAFFDREGEKITFTPLFIEAVAKAIKDFPLVNVSVDGTVILRKKEINIGIATALPSGNLIVPVVKKADMLNLTGLAKTVNDLVKKARENKLKPDDISGGTFTLTNVGTFGNMSGTPIINQPQVAILATGAIKKKPAVIETPAGDHIAIRHMMFLSLSYDHRVVDGALGGSFLRKVADYLEQFNPERKV